MASKHNKTSEQSPLPNSKEELKGKLEEISRAHSDLENLMASTELAILFLDRQLRIQRYTAVTSSVFNIMPSDHGRPIAHFTSKLNYPELVQDAEEVLHTLTPVERDVSGQDSRWYLVRQRPYRTMDDRIDGVVITVIDVTLTKRAEEAQRSLNEEMEARISERTRELDEANLKLRQTRDMFHALFHANPIPAALVRVEDGIFLDINSAYLDYMGYKREDLVGHNWREIELPVATELESALRTQLGREGMIRDLEMEFDHPSGERRTILASVQLVQLEGTDAVIATFIDITERKRSEQQVRSVASHLTASEQIERHRIARVLHDDLQQNIFAVKMHLTFLSEALEKKDLEGLQLDLKQLDEWLAKAIATTRQLSIDLSPPILQDEGLAEAIIWLASQMKEQYNLDVSVQTNGAGASFEEDIRVLVFQSVRELLFNVVKHSETLQALVTIQQIDGKAHINVSDTGKGFDSERVMTDLKVAHGLLRMRDRLHLLGCRLLVESQPNNGTKVTIEAPIKGIID
jgi:two-component system CheB/CheR fusion protein